jgi:hypothetical protein
VDPVPNLLLLRKSGSAENRTRASGSVAKNSDHYTTEAVGFYEIRVLNSSSLNFLQKAVRINESILDKKGIL